MLRLGMPSFSTCDMQDYRKLRVWRKAHELALSARRAASRFPRTGFASLRAQMTTSAESIPFNIVEGCGATSPKELARFLDISIKSTMELEYQLKLASDYGVLNEVEGQTLICEVVDTRRMLCGLRARVLAST
ncbi:MAG TPA: four helix bundle protein [Gemmatimonadaceae bacterium]|nr:four helix bundle protein [Gemmatimonadaceae bacterium]